jgi:glycosyltransferase involved in cell wall biosynthesis
MITPAKPRILHVSTAHPAYDPRIVYKQCPTLTAEYEVWCAIPNADPAVAPAVHFVRLPFFRRVLLRILITCPLVLWRCWWLRPAVVHVYSPEFIPFAFLFRWRGARIIYEVQENLYKKMHLKTINRGWLLTRGFVWFDRLAQRHFYCIFTEHGYLTTYTRLTLPHAVIYNYPLLPLLDTYRRPYRLDPELPTFFYVGLISFERAFDTLLDALALLHKTYPDFLVNLFGRLTFSQAALENQPAYATVKDTLRFHGYTDHRTAMPQSANAVAGLALIKPVGDYPESYTTKLFEYMALSLPVVTADFPLYQDVVERHQCGFCISPYDPTAVADALQFLIENPVEAQAMGERGRRAVEQHYNWDSEAVKLLTLYRVALNQQPIN